MNTEHDCPAPSCPRRVPFHALACPEHWQVIPYELRAACTRLWNDAPGSDAYIEARTACIDHLIHAAY